jgi:ribosomal protein S27E
LLKDDQKAKIEDEVKDFLALNAESGKFLPWYKCPKCGAEDTTFSPRGYMKKGKPFLKCNACGRTTVIDAGQLTYYSHHTRDTWDQVIEDTLNGVSLRKNGKEDRCSSVYRMASAT